MYDPHIRPTRCRRARAATLRRHLSGHPRTRDRVQTRTSRPGRQALGDTLPRPTEIRQGSDRNPSPTSLLVHSRSGLECTLYLCSIGRYSQNEIMGASPSSSILDGEGQLWELCESQQRWGAGRRGTREGAVPRLLRAHKAAGPGADRQLFRRRGFWRKPSPDLDECIYICKMHIDYGRENYEQRGQGARRRSAGAWLSRG